MLKHLFVQISFEGKMSQESRVNLEVNLNTLAENFMEIRRRVAPCRLMAVLKANAYGLGVQPVAAAVKAAGAAARGKSRPEAG